MEMHVKLETEASREIEKLRVAATSEHLCVRCASLGIADFFEFRDLCASFEIENPFAIAVSFGFRETSKGLSYRLASHDGRQYVCQSRFVCGLGYLNEDTETSLCSLCRLFAAVRQPSDSLYKYGLYVLRLPDSETVVPVVIAASDPQIIDSTSRYEIVNSIALARSSREQIKQLASWLGSTPAQADNINERHFDHAKFKSWLQQCETQHPACDGSLVVMRPNGLRVIDCEDRRVINAPKGEKYLALSYVWGSCNAKVSDRLSDGRLPETLPATVEDAIVVTKALGFRFLWIDRYCIDQQDHSHRQAQIQQMDLVYQNAHLTIVAAAGNDAAAGLRGVARACAEMQLPLGACSLVSRDFIMRGKRQTPDRQPSAVVGNWRLVSKMPDPEIAITASRWAERGWTFQERFFSQRRLVFTEQQVSFECREGRAWESSDVFTAPSKAPSAGSKVPWLQPKRIYPLIVEYSKRNLTYQSDAIKAFGGVLNHMESMDIYSYIGLPVVCQNGHRSFASEEKHRPRHDNNFKIGGLESSFFRGLCWRNECPGERRAQFPSWTWAGWKAGLDRWPVLLTLQQTARSNRDPAVPGETVLINGMGLATFAEEVGLCNPPNNLIELYAMVLSPSIEPAFRTKQVLGPLHQYDPDCPSFSGYFAVFRETAGSQLELRVPISSLQQSCDWLDSDELEESRSLGWDRDLEDGGPELLLVHLGSGFFRTGKRVFEPFFLLIQKFGSVYERIGHMNAPTANSLSSRGTKQVSVSREEMRGLEIDVLKSRVWRWIRLA